MILPSKGGIFMAAGSLLKIRLHENDRTHWNRRVAYEEIVRHLWSNGAPGVTVFRAEEGLDARGYVQDIHSEYLSTSLPITMEVIGTPEDMERICVDLPQLLPPVSQVMVISGVNDVKQGLSKEGWSMSEVNILRVYMKEEDRHHHMPLYHAMLKELKDLGVLWVYAQRALEGFGQEHVIHKTSLLSFSEHAPVVLEATLDPKTAVSVLDRIRPLLQKASGPAILMGADALHLNTMTR